MKILLITTYFEPDSGAAAVRLSRLARLLHQRGHQVTVLTTMPHYPQGRIAEGYRRNFSVVEDRDGIRVIRTWLLATPSPRISRKLISQLTFMIALFLRGFAVKRPDVILIEAQPVFTGLAGALLSKIKRASYVLNVSDLWPDHLLSVGAMTETQFAYRIARKLVDTMYRSSAHIVAMSPAWATAINGYLKRDDKTSVIYNGVDLDRFRPDIDAIAFRKKYDLGDERLITFIGTFSTQYDIDVMFRAVGQLPEYSVVIIGSGTQGERVDQYNLPNVRRINWVSHDEVPQAWAASRLTFWALRDETLYEGTIPAKLFELMACGVPVVCAIRGVTAQMIETADAGLVVDCGDVDGLAEAMRRMMTDDDLHDHCARSAREYAVAHFDPEKVADAYTAVLQASTNSG